MKEVLGIIANIMGSLDLNYEFMTYNSEVEYPYFVGSYSETATDTEDGREEFTFTLTGFSRTTWLALEEAREAIRKKFIDGHTEITGSGSGVAIFYENSLVIPTGDAELKKIEIYLSIKEWKVNE